MRLFFSISFSRIAIIAALFVASRAASADVLKIVADDTIHPLVVENLDRAIHEAESTHADALLVELRTPGGLMISMQEIVQKILASPVPVIVYVTPAGSDASSAGFFILESADIAAMTPGTSTGAAHPVLGSGAIMDPVMKEKMENYAASLMRSYTGKRGRNVEVAESAVRQSKSFTAEEALAQHLIDYLAKDENDLLRQIDGKTITRFDGSKATLHTVGPIRVHQSTVRERTLSMLMNPNLLFLVFWIGLLAIYTELNHPGAIVPGVVGVFSVLLVLYALHFLPFSSIALVMIALSFVVFALEAKYHTHGFLTVAGIVLMTLGALLLVDGPIPQMRVNLWAALGVSLPTAVITIFLMSIALKARRNKVVTGEQGMIGEIGVVTASLTPAGKVFVQGEIWDAVASSNIDVGQRVVVRRVENLVLQVEPLRELVPQATPAG